MTAIENRYANEVYAGLGVRPVVNAAATLTRLGGSLVAPPVLPAMAAAARNFVDVLDLSRAVGRRLAELTRNEAAYVSNGAAALLTLGVTACIAKSRGGGLLEDLPYLDKTGEKTVIMYRDQRNPYDYAVRQVGVKIVEVGPEPAELEAAIDNRTACVLWFAGAHFAAGALPIEQVVEIAHRSGVPVLVDAAAQIPPVSSLWHFTTEIGADAAIFSGGKGLRGPQSTGLMVGKPWLIAAARANGAPNHSLGRGMKVGKEEMVGLLAAVERTLQQDEPEVIARYEASVQKWIVGLSGLDGIWVHRGFPSEAGQPHGRAIVEIAPESGWSRDELIAALWRNDPAIAVAPDGGRAIALNPQTLEPGEDDLVLTELHRLLSSRSKEDT
jgi:L-seryl-tRNA(Ser) seleniumtransferase